MTNDVSEPLVLSRPNNRAWHITLNRPKAINALNLEIYGELTRALSDSQHSLVIVLDGAGERGFCGGGDIKELSTTQQPARWLELEYEIDLALANSHVPVVGFMDGVTMGGGIGLTGHGGYRVVTERSRLAMPEARIGIAPDVGGHLLLSKAPGWLGEFLAVTSEGMDAADAIALGFADYFVPSERLGELRDALFAGEDPKSACSRFAEPVDESRVLAQRSWWDPIARAAFDAPHPAPEVDPVGAAQRLIAELELSQAPEAREAAAKVRQMCPVSIAVTIAQLDRTRRHQLNLAQVLADDLRVVPRLTRRPDFAEGVRAQLIDKDHNPKWNPARIEDLDPQELSELLSVS